MLKPFKLRLKGLGRLQSIRQKQEIIIVRVETVDAKNLQKQQETRGTDICTFELHVSVRFENLFSYLQELISKKYAVILSFFANYKDCFIYNCYAEDDPDRILHFYADLEKIACVYVNGIKHSVKDLMYDV